MGVKLGAPSEKEDKLTVLFIHDSNEGKRAVGSPRHRRTIM